MNKLLLLCALVLSSSVHAGQSGQAKAVPLKIPGFEPAPASAKVSFENLKDGQTVAKKFLVKFGVTGMKVQPAGELVAGTGHHHVIVDGVPIPAGQIVIADERHIHFGKGQTEAEIELKPGNHRLTLQFANGAHLSYGPALSTTINVVVK